MAALAEIGDPAQLRCPTLAARFEIRILLVAGTTAGMLIADIPAALFAHRFADRLAVRLRGQGIPSPVLGRPARGD